MQFQIDSESFVLVHLKTSMLDTQYTNKCSMYKREVEKKK